MIGQKVEKKKKSCSWFFCVALTRVHLRLCMRTAMETLLKWKAQYSRPPCTNLIYFRSAAFDIDNIIYFFIE
jgi:hypothetical protein